MRRAVAALLAVTALGACAPDALRRDPEFEQWLRELRTECERARIGTTTVGRLLQSPGSTEGGGFLNATSRLYAGRISPEEWTQLIVPFTRARRDDPGIACVLERVPKQP
jgi:hypothetical protein